MNGESSESPSAHPGSSSGGNSVPAARASKVTRNAAADWAWRNRTTSAAATSPSPANAIDPATTA